MIDFKQAIDVAVQNAKMLLEQATKLEVEEALLSDDDKYYEITLSYELNGRDPLAAKNTSSRMATTSILELARLMSYRKEYRTFLVIKETGKFKGFKIKKQS